MKLEGFDMTKNKAKFGISCPSCGAFIRITGSAEVVTVKTEGITKDDILHLFDKSVRGNLKVIEITDRFAKLELTSRFSTKKFQKVIQEVRGYGGRFVKGHFLLPIAGLVEEK